MQHLANDATQLGSAVVLVLLGKYSPKAPIAFDGIDVQLCFLAHVFIKAGKILGVWERSAMVASRRFGAHSSDVSSPLRSLTCVRRRLGAALATDFGRYLPII
jgi:hypothetical protein